MTQSFPAEALSPQNQGHKKGNSEGDEYSEAVSGANPLQLGTEETKAPEDRGPSKPVQNRTSSWHSSSLEFQTPSCL